MPEHSPSTCGRYQSPMVCEECGKPTDSLGTRHSDWKHVCWPCLGATSVGAALHKLNKQREREARDA